jgi:hypothetical protein
MGFVVSVSMGSRLGSLVASFEPPFDGGKHGSYVGADGGAEVKSVGPLLISSSLSFE